MPHVGDAPRIHGLTALRRSVDSPLGVESGLPAEGDIREPEQLPQHRVELHAFSSTDAAQAFRDGILASGSQAVAVSPAGGPGSLVVVLARFAEERGIAGTLEEAVALVGHPSTLPAQEHARHQDLNLARQARERAHAGSWAHVDRALKALPAARNSMGGEFSWNLAKLDTRNEGRVLIEGTLDPDPGPPLDGSPMQREYRIILQKDSSGTLTATMDPLAAGVSCSQTSAAWRAAEMAEFVAKSGWTTPTPDYPFVPVWQGRVDEDGGDAFRAALLAVPTMARDLATLAQEAVQVQRAWEIAGDPVTLATLQGLAAHPEARIRLGHSGATPPHRLDTPRGGRGISHRVVELLLKRGFVMASGPVLMLTERGALAAARHAELLADAMRRKTGLEAAVPDTPATPRM